MAGWVHLGFDPRGNLFHRRQVRAGVDRTYHHRRSAGGNPAIFTMATSSWLVSTTDDTHLSTHFCGHRLGRMGVGRPAPNGHQQLVDNAGSVTRPDPLVDNRESAMG